MWKWFIGERTIFAVPYGHVGKSFVAELAHLFRVYAEGSSLESVALKAVTVLCVLLLQHSLSVAKPHDHTSCLVRRLELWKKAGLMSGCRRAAPFSRDCVNSN